MQAMSYDSIIKTVMNSDPKTDWERSYHRYNDHFECRFYAPDVNIRFENEVDNVGCSLSESFLEDWAQEFPDKNATCTGFGLYYGATLIKTFTLVFVDGGRARLPVPKVGTTIISALDYKVAQLHDVAGSLDEYMKDANFTISPE